MPIASRESPKELVFFHKGLSYDTVSSLQQPGFLKTAQNIDLSIEGKQTLRKVFANVNSTAIEAVHSLKKWRSILVAGAGTNLYANSDSGDFTNLYSSFSGGTISFRAYKDFLAGCTGTDFFLIDQSKNVYPARVANPTTAPTLSDAGSGSGPSGHYMGYVSYLITWPNGHSYETGLSSASADVNVTDNTISWTEIPLCPYVAYYGTEPTIHRKLYRGPGTGGTLGEIYYVATIEDNTTTTYSDSIPDATLSAAMVCAVADYLPPPVPGWIEWHYGRLFMIHPTYHQRLYWSEAAAGLDSFENENLMPLAVLLESFDDIRVPGFDHLDPQGLYSWGVNLYIPLKDTWIRKQGNEPATWALRKTYAKHGIGAPYTVDYSGSPGGMIGVTSPEFSEAGIAIFGGQSSEIISSPRLDYIFNSHMNLDYISQCRGKIGGRNYHLVYPSGSSTTPDAYLCIDLRRFPDIRVVKWTDLSGYSIDSDTQGKKFYIGTSTGYVKTQSDSGTSNILIETHDLMGGDPQLFNEEKTWKELKYSLKGTVTLEIIIDGTTLTWPDNTTSKSITGTGEDIQILKFPHNSKGYKISLKLTGTALSEFETYSPWQLSFD